MANGGRLQEWADARLPTKALKETHSQTHCQHSSSESISTNEAKDVSILWVLSSLLEDQAVGTVRSIIE